MLLVEIKYSESYGTSYKRFRSDGTARFGHYEKFFYDPSSPVNHETAPDLADFLYEPFYQLLRHSLLATEIMKTGRPKVDRVQVVHLAVNRNKSLLKVTSPRFRKLGDTTYGVWAKLLKEPSAFSLVYSEDFFKGVRLEDHRELEPWAIYMANRYSFLR